VVVKVFHRSLRGSREGLDLGLGLERQIHDPLVTSDEGGVVARPFYRENLGFENPLDFSACGDDPVDLGFRRSSHFAANRRCERLEPMGGLAEELCVRIVADDYRVRYMGVLVANRARETNDAARSLLVLFERVEARMDVEEGPEAGDRNEADHHENRAQPER
jgi:hypothetical protein